MTWPKKDWETNKTALLTTKTSNEKEQTALKSFEFLLCNYVRVLMLGESATIPEKNVLAAM